MEGSDQIWKQSGGLLNQWRLKKRDRGSRNSSMEHLSEYHARSGVERVGVDY
jgi:hypothetical protein